MQRQHLEPWLALLSSPLLRPTRSGHLPAASDDRCLAHILCLGRGLCRSRPQKARSAVFNGHTALIAALFRAAFHHHIHFGGIGLNNIWDGLLAIVLLAGLAFAWQSGRRSGFQLAGQAPNLPPDTYGLDHCCNRPGP